MPWLMSSECFFFVVMVRALCIVGAIMNEASDCSKFVEKSVAVSIGTRSVEKYTKIAYTVGGVPNANFVCAKKLKFGKQAFGSSKTPEPALR